MGIEVYMIIGEVLGWGFVIFGLWFVHRIAEQDYKLAMKKLEED